ncbi:hypothetical protein [Paraflavitalea speifideaquila]|uniref:hypothetical protein n=1 Tax=Paraflavitalea speifideaquila TaxID=3076558 RepID=UPI0028E8DFEB|nr:hypothetical protein [Paraflavitalea speifideiaquila]
MINQVFQQYGINKSTVCNPYMIDFPKPYGRGPKFTPELITVLDTCHCKRFTQLKNEAAALGYTPTNYNSLNQYFRLTYKDTITQALFNAFVNCSQLGIQQVCRTEYETIYAPCDATDPCGIALAAKTKKPWTPRCS